MIRVTALVLVVAHALGRGGLPGWPLGSLPLRRLPLLLPLWLGLPLWLRRLWLWLPLGLPLWLRPRVRLG